MSHCVKSFIDFFYSKWYELFTKVQGQNLAQIDISDQDKMSYVSNNFVA